MHKIYIINLEKCVDIKTIKSIMHFCFLIQWDEHWNQKK